MLSLRFPIPIPTSKTNVSPHSHSHKASPSFTYNNRLQKGNELSALSTLSKFDKAVLASASSNTAGQIIDGVVVDQEQLPEGLRRDQMPRHVAFFADGNRRWGKQKGLPPLVSYVAGAQRFKEIASLCYKWGIEVVSVFAFASGNWLRPQEDIDFSMDYFERDLKSYLEGCVRMGIRVSVIGNKSRVPDSLQTLINEVEEATKDNSQFHLIAPLDYDGQYDIIQACKKVAKNVKDGLLQPEDITTNVIEQELLTSCAKFPNPDLFIRTGGKQRMSNFMLWQLAYAEFYFVDKFWPDFDKVDLVEALHSFQARQRRFGGQA